jgi:hypothetical protein
MQSRKIAAMGAWIDPEKHFDTSGKSPAQLHHSAICRMPLALSDKRADTAR